MVLYVVSKRRTVLDPVIVLFYKLFSMRLPQLFLWFVAWERRLGDFIVSWKTRESWYFLSPSRCTLLSAPWLSLRYLVSIMALGFSGPPVRIDGSFYCWFRSKSFNLFKLLSVYSSGYWRVNWFRKDESCLGLVYWSFGPLLYSASSASTCGLSSKPSSQ